MKKIKRIVITLPQFLKKKLEEKAQQYECSQAEVIRFALMRVIETEK